MITNNEGGFFTRSMPPADWDCGPVPEECYNPALGKRDIEEKLLKVYLEEDRVKKLADSDYKIEIFKATIALEIMANIDADTIWCYNTMTG